MSHENERRGLLDAVVATQIAEDRQVIEAAKQALERRGSILGLKLIKESEVSATGSSDSRPARREP
jgi:hypothetical protein